MTPIEAPNCALHESYTRWQDQRWDEQAEKNKSIQACLEGLRSEISSIKNYIAMGIGVMAALQVLAPIFFKLIGVK